MNDRDTRDAKNYNTPSKEAIVGAISASAAFLIWGFSPIYFKILRDVPAFEILMHRVVWSFLLLMPLILISGQWNEFKAVIKSYRTMIILTVSTTLVAANWFLFIWAINNDQILQTSLGYYINPLVNVILGMIFLKERLNAAKSAAVLIAGFGVLYLTVNYGKLPWISLTLAVTFAFYGLIRKIAPVNALVGLTIETLILSLPALGYLIYLDTAGIGSIFRMSVRIDILLVCTVLVTAPPLLFFTIGARKIHLATLGIIQYIAPSCTFLLAVFIYDEPFTTVQIWTFGMIWTALIIYSVDSVLEYRKR